MLQIQTKHGGKTAVSASSRPIQKNDHIKIHLCPQYHYSKGQNKIRSLFLPEGFLGVF